MGKKEESTDNKRDTVFIWDGILTSTPIQEGQDAATAERLLKWEGTWTKDTSALATKIPAPHRNAFKEFVDSDMTFEVEGTAKPIESSNKQGSDRLPFTASFTTKGKGWDGEDGEKHFDERHDIVLPSLCWTGDLFNQLLFGKGKNEQGVFIEAGWMRPGNRLTLARRFLAEDGDDVRASWDLKELGQRVTQEIYDEKEDNYRIPPWQCEIFDTDYNEKKRKKEDEEETDNKKTKE